MIGIVLTEKKMEKESMEDIMMNQYGLFDLENSVCQMGHVLFFI